MKDFFVNFLENIKANFATPESIVFSILDIVVTFAIAYIYIMLLKRNKAMKLFKYALVFIVACILIGKTTDFPVLNYVSTYAVLIFFVTTLIVYGDDIRRSLRKLSYGKADNNHVAKNEYSEEELRATISDIVKAVQDMSKRNTGALIIIAPENIPTSIIDSGTKLDANISSQLLEGLFVNKAPLHDGAVIISGTKILAAGCFLPLSQNINLDKDLGTRHRAAIGETEQYNHLAIIVSEESGVISVAQNGELIRFYDSVMLTDVLEQVYKLKASTNNAKRRR